MPIAIVGTYFSMPKTVKRKQVRHSAIRVTLIYSHNLHLQLYFFDHLVPIVLFVIDQSII